jgi:hypothetical protein
MLLRPLLIPLLAGLLSAGAAAAQTVCALDGATLQTGQAQAFYSQRSVPLGQSCDAVAQQRRCDGTTLDGAASFRFARCTELEEFLGVNTNRKAENLDADLLARSGTSWIRSNMEILEYKQQQETGKRDPKWDFAAWDFYIAAAAGDERKAILNLMWDFAAHNAHPPKPGSERERDLFEFLDLQILDKLAPHVDILVTGNEIFVNTLDEDWEYRKAYGGIPAVVFYSRVTEHVNAYLIDRGLRDKVDLYVGAFTRLDLKKMQGQPAVRALLSYAETADYVDGVDMHTHVVRIEQIDSALAFARSFTAKPIIVTEFTFVWQMKKAIESNETLGAAFAGRWGRDPDQQIEDYMACEVFGLAKGCKGNGPVSKAEWDDFFATRDWFIDHFILQADAVFRKYGVRGATFGLVQGPPRKAQMNPDRPPWYLGFLFSAAIEPGPDGALQPNYQYLDDFRTIQQQRAAVARN